jgi:phytoene synthase
MPQRWSDSGASARDLAACRALLRGGSRTFHAASFLLPRRVREPACALYAFCRLADDAVDLDAGATAALGALRERLDRVYAGRPHALAADRAFAEAVRRFRIPRALPEALLEGFEWDASGRRYPDLDALYAYAARVAGSVGAMMALLMGVRAPALLARACDLGVAMQLTNIARDVGEDARAGRLYLPLDWLREAGIDAQAWLASPCYTPALGGVAERLLAAADGLYRRASAGIGGLPLACRPGVHAARLVYAEIGHELRRRALDSVSQRVVVSPGRKALLLVRAAACSALPAASSGAPPLAQTRFLVEAAIGSLPASATRAALPAAGVARAVDARFAWLCDLFERLERRDRAHHAARAARRMAQFAERSGAPADA